MAEKVKDVCASLCKGIIEDLGYELVEVEYQKERNGMNLIFYIDSEKGIGVQDCEKVTHAIEGVLDEANPTKDASYTLVVSSLGIDRPLKTSRDFERNLGKEIEVKFYAPDKELKVKEVQGTLMAYSESDFTLATEKFGEIKIERKLTACISPVLKF